MTVGSGIQLRSEQIATILSSVLSATPSATGIVSNPTVTVTAAATAAAGTFTAGALAGIACGVGLPLLVALCAVLILWRREKRKHAPPKLMYKLPDDKDEFTFRPPTAPHTRPSASRVTSYANTSVSGMAGSESGSMRTVASERPAHMQNFAERYQSMRSAGMRGEPERHELDSSAAIQDMIRHELGVGRRSRT
ncbi:hypothetical protein LTR62_005958 [Meristemomyces frigidus]|uniref:Uncharacterized protein n=1 Tax=Meristemomyces frigidus TaxID=1508187 RepID=A0AAN7TP17_9PEZI|nr:hypothetical protein LTR62_005958 [Meristemomyces frigidus]